MKNVVMAIIGLYTVTIFFLLATIALAAEAEAESAKKPEPGARSDQSATWLPYYADTLKSGPDWIRTLP